MVPNNSDANLKISFVETAVLVTLAGVTPRQSSDIQSIYYEREIRMSMEAS